jgi:hypothetical protein
MKTSSRKKSSYGIFRNRLQDAVSGYVPLGRVSFTDAASNGSQNPNQETISKSDGSAGSRKNENKCENIPQKSLFPDSKKPWIPVFRERVTKSSLNRKLGTANRSLADLPEEIVQAYGRWIKNFLDHGWDGYLFTFMFQQLSGPEGSRMEQMHKEIDRIYRKLINRVVRKPPSEKWACFLPKGVFYPDVPGLKSSKQSLRDARVNDGLHFHGVMVANRWARMKERLDIHFQEKQTEYLSDTLRRIHVEPITHESEFVADYAGKAIKRKRFPMDRMMDHILVLPKPLSELPDRNVNVYPDPRERAIKAIQSASNVSEEVARELYDATRAKAKKG